MLKYGNFGSSLEKEDGYDDFDCADYEMADYSAMEDFDEDDEDDEVGEDDEDDEADETAEKDDDDDGSAEKPFDKEDVRVRGAWSKNRQDMVKPGRKQKKTIFDEFPDIYTCRVPVDTEEEARIRYTRLKCMVIEGTPEEQKAAKYEACLHMVGLIRQLIRSFYQNYVEQDPSYAFELMNESFSYIIKFLPKYDPEKGAPSTFFQLHIKSALSKTTTKTKHNMSSSDSALKRKIKRLQKEYCELGVTLTVADIQRETGESQSKIIAVSKAMEMDNNTHLEAIEEYDQLIAGDPIKNRSYESPEKLAIEHITLSNIIKRGCEMFGCEKMGIYLRNKAAEESIQEIAKSYGGKYNDDKIRRIIEEVQHGMDHDWRIRQLGAGHIRDNDIGGDPFLPILPVSGQNDNMDLLDIMVI